ncbi:class I SAM-dependent methyltransferase [Colwellia sp. 1_MG-2023]|uniref:class I SAM-dependent methyltransferase n=1 Tax=Colwellia sp. 1_MG-2023 TaxID=3062649 RepID=UPI0026E3B898|nr:class I SAM-dependent methyltransferase [Colwellia sp. 1_MG-2023]MDO6444394.1 class I SAM-dependent methyltransferase [Colwellia sp. 1_MG-2023]
MKQQDIWQDIYTQGQQLNRYPWDSVVSFLFACKPDKPRAETRILEVGCGAGNNLWFAAREGFNVTGIDFSAAAIEYAKSRFDEEHLKGNFVVGSFDQLPEEEKCFDLIIDRGALVCAPLSEVRHAIEHIHKLLDVNGKFLFTPFSQEHSCFDKDLCDEDFYLTITQGPLKKVGKLSFINEEIIRELFSQGWKIHSLRHISDDEKAQESDYHHAEYRVIVEKIK